MKKSILSVICILLCISMFPTQLFAYPHGYERHTDDIYAIARYDIEVYADEGGDFVEYLPAFTGFRVIYTGDYWREIEYQKDGDTRIGWITDGEFNANCLTYDGRDKQVLADGSYRFSAQDTPAETSSPITNLPVQTNSEDFSLDLTLTYVGDDSFTLRLAETDYYLKSDITSDESHNCSWGYEWDAGLFVLDREDGKYSIRDFFTGYYLHQDENGMLSFRFDDPTLFNVTRTDGKVLGKDDLRVYVQYDGDWAHDHYGHGEEKTSPANNFCTSACGIFATMNAIYTLTGKYIDPHILANYAVEHGYRIEDNGTDSGIFYAAAERYGKSYGFKYDGASGNVSDLRDMLENGDVAIAHVPGHYIAIVDYNKDTEEFLLLDSHYLPKRETCPYGDWVTASVLEEGTNLTSQMYYFYKTRK